MAARPIVLFLMFFEFITSISSSYLKFLKLLTVAVSKMDTMDDDIPIEDLQIHTVNNREKYTSAIQRLLDKCSRYCVKALGSPNPNLNESFRIPELVFNHTVECNNHDNHEKITNALKEQIKILTILNKQQNCPIAQKMKEL